MTGNQTKIETLKEIYDNADQEVKTALTQHILGGLTLAQEGYIDLSSVHLGRDIKHCKTCRCK